MVNLSVNVNKIALLRNSRGGSVPDLVRFALDAERSGAQGITVHPRPDERHIRKTDVYALKEAIATELNIEGYPSPDFLKMVLEVAPAQCTLVPDDPTQLTSDHGWDTVTHLRFLQEAIAKLQHAGIRVSIFLDPDLHLLESARQTGTDRIELYTGPYAEHFLTAPEEAVKPYALAAEAAHQMGLGINAGHDLNRKNLRFFAGRVPALAEVSIGHALVADCLYFGLDNTIPMYLRELA